MSWICGVDVSAAQGVINWDLVPKSIIYVIEKASEGVSYVDPTRVANREGAKRTGRLWAPYGFIRVSQGDAVKQAKNLWDATGEEMPDFAPVLDLENAPDNTTAEQLVYFFLAVADAVEGYFGRPPIVYTYPWFERSRIAPAVKGDVADRLARCPLWMADYSGGETPPAGWHPFTPAPWKTWTFAQTSGNNSSFVPGISGHVDHDIFNGDAAALRALRGLPDAPPASSPIVHPAVPFDPPSDVGPITNE